jgi:mono/diheme cytochrome c family protein
MKTKDFTRLTVLIMSGLIMSSGAAAQQPDQIAEGARVYGNTCGTCHNARSPIERTDQEWITIVNHMRVRGNLTGRQARAVLAFLQGSNGSPDAPTAVPAASLSDAVPTGPALVELGSTLIAQKACIGCHVIGGVGGNVGPGLEGVVEARGARFVRQKLLNPTFNNSASLMPNLGLTTQEVDALVAYLATVRRTLERGGS